MAHLFRGVQHAKVYQKYRPEYPAAVYSAILKYLGAENDSCRDEEGQDAHSPEYHSALDLGCGTGISTVPLSGHFRNVIGVDVSESQIEEARTASKACRNVTYRVGSAEELGFQGSGSVDLITIAQALHWIDGRKFYPECHRILRPGGVLAAYGYGVPRLNNPEAQSVLKHFHDVTLGEFWEAGRRHIVNCFQELYKEFAVAFPLSERIDNLVLEKSYSMKDFLGYIQSWSAYQTYRSRFPEAKDPLINISSRLQTIFSVAAGLGIADDKPTSVEDGGKTSFLKGSGDEVDSEIHLLVTSPIFILLGRKTLL